MLLLLGLLGLVVPILSQDPLPPVYRLPTTITPLFYAIQLNPDLDSGNFDGTILIQFSTTSNESQTLNSITLHLGTNIIINEPGGILMDSNGKKQEIGAYIYDDANTLLTMKLPDGAALKFSHFYAVKLPFKSTLNKEPKGLFTGNYNSSSKYIASNFRATHAREVFPCFDEPQYKVPISLQVWRPVSYYAVSTAPLAYSSPVSTDNKVLDTFSTTDPISIHSLGLFIAKQEWTSSMGVNLAVPTNFPTTVPYLDTLISGILAQFGNFPQGTLRFIVLPDRTCISFSSYGFVFTSPEVYLGKEVSSLQWTSLKLQLTEELLRQFLEFSKTPHWWSDVWLSESIGAYLSLPFQLDEPWLENWLKIVVRSLSLGEYNSLTGAVLINPQLSKWDIENIIANQSVKLKGLSTLLMWTDTMPEGLVKKTISDFISLPQSIVNTNDLVSLMVTNIEANTTYDVTATIPTLTNWLSAPGSPLIWLSVNPSLKTFILNQTTPFPPGSPDTVLHPISVATAEGPTPVWDNIRQGHWLLNASSEFTFSSEAYQGSVINIESAPYRVNYDNSHWESLTQALSTGWAPAAVSSALQDDAVALSLNGYLDFSTALSVLNSSEHTSLDWYPVVKATEAIIAKIGGDWYGFTAFGTYFAGLFSAELLENLDLRSSNSNLNLSVTRELVTPFLCRFNISTCREAVVELGSSLWQGNTSWIAESDFENVACYGAQYTPGVLELLLDAYQSASNARLRRYYTIALSCLTDQSSVNDLLATIFNTNTTRVAKNLDSNGSQVTLMDSDVRQILVGLASWLENSDPLLNIVTNQAPSIQSKYGVDTLSSIIKNLAKNRADLSQLSSLQGYAGDLDPYVLQTADEALARSRFSQSWYTTYNAQLYQALPQGSGSITTTAPTAASTTSSNVSSATTSITSTTTTTSQPGPVSTPTPAPHGGASSLYDYRVFTVVLMGILVALDVTVH